MRWLILLNALLVATLAATADTNPPPSVPTSRERPRLVHNKWTMSSTLYHPSDMVSGATADMMIFAASQMGCAPNDVIPALKSGRLFAAASMPYIRYVTTYNYPLPMREKVYLAVTKLLNELSRNGTIVRPAVGGPDNTLIRINLFDYGIDPAVWDRIVAKEPYFHTDVDEFEITTRKVWTTYVGDDGKTYYKTYLGADGKTGYYFTEVTDRKVKSKVRAATNWSVNPQPMADLQYMVQSKCSPIIRADWFLVNCSRAQNYYDLLGIKTLADFNKLTAFDDRAKVKQARATIVTSGSEGLCTKVARNNRILVRFPTFQGYYWFTIDFLTSTGAQNVLNNFVDENKIKPDAKELIASLPCGLQAYVLTDGNDKLLVKADPNIAVDSMAVDQQLVNGRSCMWCHAAGINPFKSSYQTMFGFRADQNTPGFYDKNPEKALKLSNFARDVFDAPNFDQVIADDNNIYTKAMILATNSTPEVMASLYKQLYDGYDEERLDINRIAYEVGLCEADIRALLGLRINGVGNAVLLQQLLAPPVSIRRDQWEEVFGDVMKLTMLRRAK